MRFFLFILFLSFDALSACYKDSYKYNCYVDGRLYYSGTMQTSNKSSSLDALYIGNTLVGYLSLTGYGTFYFDSGDTYTGDFLNGNFHGLGKSYDSSGRLKYDGRYKNNKRTGFGKLYTTGGSIYSIEGDFKDGDPVGRMHIIYRSDSERHYAFSDLRAISGYYKFTGETVINYRDGAIKESKYSARGDLIESKWVVSPEQSKQNKLIKDRENEQQRIRDLAIANERKRKQKIEDKIYDACILEKIPDAKTEAAAELLRQSCRDISKNPTNWQLIWYLGFEGAKEIID
jgi:antitoxin component YwqK of YwqJK toxin-antitoxin module